ncbi:hypothetical protein [Paracoccus sp. (in: a-proteobacteria)]|nr:hypothetical protein [Paracoccus sp. (in: a-proteobacteria)]
MPDRFDPWVAGGCRTACKVPADFGHRFENVSFCEVSGAGAGYYGCMPILMLLPIAAAVAISMALVRHGWRRDVLFLLGGAVLTPWLLYLVALVQMDLPP